VHDFFTRPDIIGMAPEPKKKHPDNSRLDAELTEVRGVAPVFSGG